MKKIVTLLLTLIIMLSSAASVSAQPAETDPPVDIYAQTTEPETTATAPESAVPETNRDTDNTTSDEMRWDCLNVNPDEIDQLMIEDPDSQVIKKYLALFPVLFDHSTDAQEIIKNQDRFAIYVILKDGKIVSRQRINNGKAEEYREITSAASIIEKQEYKNISLMVNGKEVLSKISADIEVNNTYYFEETMAYTRYGIYYETNLGNYFLLVGSKEYLFPIDDFMELMERFKAENQRRFELYGKQMGGVDLDSFISENMDLSNYDINSTSFDLKAGHDKLFANDGGNDSPYSPAFFENKILLWGSVAAVGALLVAVTVIVTVRVKKNRKIKTEE